MSTGGHMMFKVYLHQGSSNRVIRRFSIKTEHSDNYQYLVNTITATFPELDSCYFNVLWNDSEDMVHISSNEELILALQQMKEPVKKIHVTAVKKSCGLTGKVNKTYHPIHFAKVEDAEKVSATESVSKNKQQLKISKPNESVLPKNETNDLEFGNHFERLNRDIELIRAHLFNSNGSISKNYNGTKLQTLEECQKKLQCIIDNLSVQTSAASSVNSLMSTHDKSDDMSDNRSLISSKKDLSMDVINIEVCSLEMETNQAGANSVLADSGISNSYSHEMVNDDGSSKDDQDTVASVKTLSEVSSDEECDKWTLLENDDITETESLPDITDRLAKLKATSTCITSVSNDQSADSPVFVTVTVEGLPQSENPHVNVPVVTTISTNEQSVTYCASITDPSVVPGSATLNPRIDPRANLPHITKGLEILQSMGFDIENSNLIDLLETFNGNIDSLQSILRMMKEFITSKRLKGRLEENKEKLNLKDKKMQMLENKITGYKRQQNTLNYYKISNAMMKVETEKKDEQLKEMMEKVERLSDELVEKRRIFESKVENINELTMQVEMLNKDIQISSMDINKLLDMLDTSEKTNRTLRTAYDILFAQQQSNIERS